MNRKKENRKKYILLVSVIVAMLLLWVTAYSIATDRKLTFVEKGIKDSVLMVGDLLGTPVRYLKNKWDILQNSEKIYNQYQEIVKEHSTFEQYQETIKELETENEKLKDLLDLNSSLSNYEKVSATVINRNMNYWLESFTIDKGEANGIKKNMAVVGNGGLIGYISQVSNSTSTVKLLTNANLSSPVSVKIKISNEKSAYGLLTGYDREKQAYIIEGISDYGQIPVNAKVTTTGLGDRFPSGLLIGSVLDIQTDSFDLSKIVYIKPSTSIDDISFVSVLIREGDLSE